MARYNDLSPDFRRWTNAKLMREARSVAHTYFTHHNAPSAANARQVLRKIRGEA